MPQLLTQSSPRRSTTARDYVTDLLSSADISIGGHSPGDIVVHDERFFDRLVADGSLGLGEAYMDGWWDADRLDVFFAKVLRARLDDTAKSRHQLFIYLRSKLLNMQTRRRSKRVDPIYQPWTGCCLPSTRAGPTNRGRALNSTHALSPIE